MTDDIKHLLADAGRAGLNVFGHETGAGDCPAPDGLCALTARAVLAKLGIQIEGYEWGVEWHWDPVPPGYEGTPSGLISRETREGAEAFKRRPGMNVDKPDRKLHTKLVCRLKAKTEWEDAP